MARLPAKTKALVYSNLEKYARSGMGMEKACESLLRQPGISRAERGLYRGLLAGLAQGKSIGDALGGASVVVSSLEHEIVAAAESGGKLEAGFGHLAEYFRRLDKTRRKILKGLAYPLVLIHLAIPVSTLAMTAFGAFRLDGGGSGLDFRGILATSGWTMLGAYLAVALLLFLAWTLNRLARTSGPIDAILARVPFVGNARRAVGMERFSRVFEIFLLSGRTMSESLAGAGRASGSGLLLAASRRGSRIVAGGDSLATALHASPGAYPNDFARGLAVAEEAGQLDRELAEWGRFYADTAAEAMEQLAEWAPKLFYWAVLVFVATLIIRAVFAYGALLERLSNWGG